MRKRTLWKRVAALAMTAAMLMTSVSSGFAAEESAVPEELAGISTIAEEAELPAAEDTLDVTAEESADADEEILYLEDSEIEEAEVQEDTAEEEEIIAESLIEDIDILTASDEDDITITINPNGGYFWNGPEDTDPKEMPWTKGEELAMYDLYHPDRDGKLFVGWATDPEGKNKVLYYDEDEEEYATIYPDEDIVLYAVWVDCVTFTLDPNGGYWWGEDEETEPEIEKAIPGTEINFGYFEYPEHASKAFVGWSTDPEGKNIVLDEDKEFIAKDNMYLYAVWKDAYKVDLDPNGGYWEEYCGDVSGYDTSIISFKVPRNSQIDCYDYEPEHKTQSFMGWATDKAGNNIVLSRYLDNKRTYTVSQNTTLYAAWADTVTITVQGNGGLGEEYNENTEEWEHTASVLTYKWPKGTTFDELYRNLFTRDGYIITGWKVNSIIYKPWERFVVNSNITIEAQWEKKVTIKWHLNGGDLPWYGDDDEPCPDPYIEELAVGERFGSLSAENEGFALIGWSKTPGSDDPYLKLGTGLTAETDLDLYAIWAEAVKVTFDGNGGNYTSYDGTVTTVDCWIPVGESIGMYYPSFNYAGTDGKKAFYQWARDKDGKELFGWDETISGETTLYAIWTPGVEVTFDLNGGSDYGATKYSIIIQKDVIIEDHFYYYSDIQAPSGMTFGGWSLKKDDASTKITSYKLTQDVILYALWNPSAPAPAPAPASTTVMEPAAPAEVITISKTPTGVKAKSAKKGQATITWKKFKETKKTKAIWKKVKKVEIQYSQDKTFKTGVITKMVGKKKTSLTIKKLEAGKTYFVRVRYYEANLKVSKWSGVKKVKVKK